MIDAHNHLHDPRFQGRQAELIASMQDHGITACIVNGTSEADWPAVAALAEQFPDFILPAFGLHPWQVEKRSSNWLKTLTNFLNNFPHASLGECGLDRWMKNPDLESQHTSFRDQLQLAHDLNRPVTIHCLKAWGPLLEELHAFKKLPRFLLHSFGGSLEIARECQKLGAFFSFSGYFLHPRKAKVRETFAQLNSDRILVETDAPDMAPPPPSLSFEKLNHPANLPEIAGELSRLCHIPLETFETNTRRFLGHSA